jgi:hypothetical protein
MATEDEREVVVERRVDRANTAAGGFAAVFIVLGVIAAVAIGWWAVGTTPLPDSKVSQVPPAATSPDTTSGPRTTGPEGGSSGKAL